VVPPPASPFQDAEEQDRLGNLQAAARLYEELLPQHPGHAAAHHNYAMVLRKLGRVEDALGQANVAHGLMPDHPTIVFSLALSHESTGNLAKAESFYQDAIDLKPDYPAALNNLGRLFEAQNRPREALGMLEKAQALAPEDEDIRLNLANTHLSLGKPEAALALLQDMSGSSVSNARGIARYVQRDWASASGHFRDAIAADSSFAGAHENLALSLLHEGTFEEGWQEYRWRWQNPDNYLTNRHFSIPLWDGTDLSGRHLLLHAEQGFGDTIQFVRFGYLVEKSGGAISWAVQQELVELLSDLPWADEVVSLDGSLPEADCHLPLASLPGLLDPMGEKVRNLGAYISIANATRPAVPISEDLHTFKIGICWAGRDKHLYDSYRNRSCPPEIFHQILELNTVQLISLQTGPAARQVPNGCESISSSLTDFTKTADAIMQLDLVITIDTALAHLCGALGKPGLVALNYAADWRWEDGNGTAPWYPSLTMFRQPQPGDWNDVFDRILTHLKEEFGR